MSAPSSFPCFQIPTSPLSRNSSSTSSSPCSSSSPCIFPTVKSMTRTRTTYSMSFYVRSSQTEGPLRRPVVTPPTPPSRPPESSVSAPKPVKRVEEDTSVITMEFQRQKAKELQDYFKQKKLEEANQGPFFGFLPKNEIANGRWAMFGFAVGLLTEYATGSDFVDQLKILLSNFGIVDLE